MVNDAPGAKSDAGLTLAVRATRALAWVFAAAAIACVVWVMIGRFVQQAECEWMASAIRDGVDRVKGGQQLYARPSENFIAYIYPPLYFWVSALVAKTMSTLVACRLVSVLATLVTLVAIAKIARALGATREWAALSVALYFGAYSYTLYFYDLERVDALEAALASTAVALLVGSSDEEKPSTGLLRAGGTGALLALAYFAKQPGLFAFAAVLGGLGVMREWRKMAVVAATGLVTAGGIGAYVQSASGGWFSYYVLKLPSAHGIKGSLVSLFWLFDAPKGFLLTAATFGLVAVAAYGVLRRKQQRWKDVVFASVVGSSMFGAFLLRAHVGGFFNVLMCWTPFACAAVGIAATRITGAFEERRARATVEIGLFTALALQLASWTFDPNEITPGSHDVRADQELARVVKTFEKHGEVLVSTTGGLTTPPHFHAAALYDILRAGYPMPPDYEAKLRNRGYAAMLLGAPNETECSHHACDDTGLAVLENYFVAGRLPTPLRTSFVGFDARPGWIMRPRKHPLSGVPLKSLMMRARVEQAYADMLEAAGGSDVDHARWHDEIEDLAAEQLQREAKQATSPAPAP
ncbi:MAG: hypothetical protein JST00_39810 [Deltaproteobacteria bacterium]|nr:hypothetical protein [Deltaproteobacteria bacterium]